MPTDQLVWDMAMCAGCQDSMIDHFWPDRETAAEWADNEHDRLGEAQDEAKMINPGPQ